MNIGKTTLAIACAVVLSGFLAGGCGSSGDAPSSSGTQASAGTEPGNQAVGTSQTPIANGALPAEGGPPASAGAASAVALPFGNEKGELVCPVMGTVMADASKAVDSEEYKGTKYYFCCGGCPEQFRANPEKFADGKAIKM